MTFARAFGAIVLGILVSAGVSASQQPSQFRFTVRILGGLDGSDIWAAPTFRVRAGQPATMTMGDRSAHRLGLAITPTDAGLGKVALHVLVTVDRAGTESTAEFDLLTGAGTVPPVVAVRDAAGKPLVLNDGRPFFMQIEGAGLK